MAKQVMRRSAADNPYFHRDFHGAMSAALEYLDRAFGRSAVVEYLQQFASRFYAPLADEIRRRGLPALMAHIQQAYAREGVEAQADLDGEHLTVTIPRCPAVTHMRTTGYHVADAFSETTETVYRTICRPGGFDVEMLDYDTATGASRLRFFRSRP